MFYAEEKINSILNCKKCSNRYEEPRILPCGNTICHECVTTEKNEYSCYFCEKNHDKPVDGFPINKSLGELLRYAPNDIYRGKSVEVLKSSLKELHSQADLLELTLKTGVDKIKDLCLSLKIDLDLATESAMSRIAELRDSLLAEINLYEGHSIECFQADLDTSREFTAKIEEIREFHKTWTDYLKQPVIDDEIIEKSTKAARSLKNNASSETLKLNAFIFNKKQILFEKSPDLFKSSLLGTITSKSLLNTFLQETNSIDIGAFLKDAKPDSIEIDHLDNDSFHIVYTTGENLLKCFTLHSNDMTVQSPFTFEYKYSFLRSVKKYGNTIVTSSYGSGAYHVDILNLSLVRISYNNLSDVCKSYSATFLSVNDTHVYYYIKTKELPLLVFRKEQGYLSFERKIGQACDPLVPFYLPETIKQFEANSGRYYWLSGTHLNVLDARLGTVVSSIEVKASKFLFDSKLGVVLFDEATREINFFDGDLNLVERVYVENLVGSWACDSALFLNQADEPFVFKKSLKKVCFYRKVIEYNQ